MATVNLKNNMIHLYGELPDAGKKAPDFHLARTDLADVDLKTFRGMRLVLNIFPSLDTPVCAASVRRFNQMAAVLENTKVLCISRDTPFAHERFCATEGIKNVYSLSDIRSSKFGKDYGVLIKDGPMAGLLARAVIILNENHQVIYRQLVPEITNEPDYDQVLDVLKNN